MSTDSKLTDTTTDTETKSATNNATNSATNGSATNSGTNSGTNSATRNTTRNTTKGGYRFRVHDDAIALCRLVKTLAALIERHDRKMAAQLRTATSAVVLNTAEGAGRRGGHQRERLSTALWSSREVKANLEASEALGYLAAGEIASEASDKADKICATLWKCLHR